MRAYCPMGQWEVRCARHTWSEEELIVPCRLSPISLLADLQDVSAGRSGMSIMPNRNIVFVVDDDPGMLRGVKRLLRQHGYDSILFASAEAFQNHDDFEEALCIILDINLNDESGIELRRRLKAAGILVPVIYITGNDNPAVRKAALESGCLAYLTKPFSAKALIAPVERASARPPLIPYSLTNGPQSHPTR